MKKIKTSVRITVIAFVGLVVGVNLYGWNAKSLMGNALPMPMGYGAAVVLTGSMEPNIMADDLIIVAEREDYAVDDVVVYQSDSILVVHRIVDITGGMVITQGDANTAPDEPVELTAINGKVIGLMATLVLFMQDSLKCQFKYYVTNHRHGNYHNRHCQIGIHSSISEEAV